MSEEKKSTDTVVRVGTNKMKARILILDEDSIEKLKALVFELNEIIHKMKL